MQNLIVVDNPKTWPLQVRDVPLVSARAYLTDREFSDLHGAKVFNLCRSYRYQSAGYYVSLLAMARGHKPLPSIATIQDLKSPALTRVVGEDLDELIQHAFRRLTSPTFTLSVYFGQNLAGRYEELSSRLFRLFPAPLLRADFRRVDDEWEIQSVRPIAANDIPEAHRAFVIKAAEQFFAGNRLPAKVRRTTQYDLAILHSPDEQTPPSNGGAIKKFIAAARSLKLGVELIEQEDFGRLAEFDALFIRTTTYANHYTYRFARRAAAEGLVVIDDPESIVKCTNKVYLAELLQRNRIPTPRTIIVHRDNRDSVPALIPLPCVLKRPDSSFSQGVIKADDQDQLCDVLDQLMEKSDLVIAQEFVPTEFDWRIGVLDRQPLFACRYFMVRKHWQIARRDTTQTTYGDVEAVPLESVPPTVVRTALRAARLIGDGLYGVDVKQVGKRVVVMEVNENPSIDSGYDDAILKDTLYERIMQSFLARIERSRAAVR